GSTRHEGLELGVSLLLSDEWSASTALAYARHEFRDYRISTLLDYSGNEMRSAPRTMANTEVVYEPARLAGVRVALEWVHLGSYWMNDANDVRYGGHELINLRASYRRSAWTFWAKLMNIGGEHYAESAASSFAGPPG